jgi:hypothetical protein
MAASRTPCTVESVFMLMIYSNILLLLIFVFGILTHDTLLRPTNHRVCETKELQFMNAAEQDNPCPSFVKSSSPATLTVRGSNIPTTSQHGSNQPNYKKAITYEITHLLLVLLQYKCCSQILWCNPDQPGRTVTEVWRTLAFSGAGGSVLYALLAFAAAQERSQAISSNGSTLLT